MVYLGELKTAVLLLLVAMIQIWVDYEREHKSGHTTDFNDLMAPTAHVLRDGELRDIPATHLVLGDVVELRFGDIVPADVRLLSVDGFMTDDFALTGASSPVRKFTASMTGEVPPAARHNLAYASTAVTAGQARGIVVATGMHSELGRIAALAPMADGDVSLLQRQWQTLTRHLTLGVIVVIALVVFAAIPENLSLHTTLLFMVAGAIALLPNGLNTAFYAQLSHAVRRIARGRALVKKPSAADTLGAVDILLLDKTGLLTHDTMTATEFVVGRSGYRVSGEGYEANGTVLGGTGRPLARAKLDDLQPFFEAAVCASNARVMPPDASHARWHVDGDATEGALITLSRKAGFEPSEVASRLSEVHQLPFDAVHKRVVSVRFDGKDSWVFVKGAPEAVLPLATRLWDHGHTRKMSAADHDFFSGYSDSQTNDANRTLAVAYRKISGTIDSRDLRRKFLEQDLTLLGVISMHDPLRANIPAALESAKHAGVKVSIITNDHAPAARAFAVHAGLGDALVVLTADELNRLADSQVAELLSEGGAVFSRIAPEDRLRLVQVAKHSRQTVAISGDSITDIPALRRADIGVAMGKTGTLPAQTAAEVVLLDDNAATLIRSLQRSRNAFHQASEAVRGSLQDNGAQLFLVALSFAATIWFHVPLAIALPQLLLLQLLFLLAPLTGLAWDKSPAGLMQKPPRLRSQRLLDIDVVRDMTRFGVIAGALAYANFLYFFVRHQVSAEYIAPGSHLYIHASTLVMVTLALCGLINLSFNRVDRHRRFFTRSLIDNRNFLAGSVLSFIAISAVLYTPLAAIFDTGPLSLGDWTCALIAAAAYFSLRLLQRHTRKHTRRAVVQLHRKVNQLTRIQA
jgi:Ca2+-transporting ATPase